MRSARGERATVVLSPVVPMVSALLLRRLLRVRSPDMPVELSVVAVEPVPVVALLPVVADPLPIVEPVPAEVDPLPLVVSFTLVGLPLTLPLAAGAEGVPDCA